MERILGRFSRDNAFESKGLRQYYARTYGINIGLYSSIGFFDRWRVPPGTTVGRYSSMATSARLIEANHPTEALSTHPFFYMKQFGLTTEDLARRSPQVIGDDVWIGHNSVITPGCTRIGRGAIIGAGAVVMGDVPAYAILQGAPAKLVRYRFSRDLVALIEASEWWLLDKEQLERAGRSAPGFLTAPTVENATAFLRASGKTPPEKTASAQHPSTIEPSSIDQLLSPNVAAIIRSVVPGYRGGERDQRLSEVGLDSLGYLNLRLALENLRQAPIPDNLWGAVSTVGDLARLAPDDRLSPPETAHGPVARGLYWLPSPPENFEGAVIAVALAGAWDGFVHLARHRLDYLEVGRLDAELRALKGRRELGGSPAKRVKIAVLSSSTSEHLSSAIRIAGVRRDLDVDLYFCNYGQYIQELYDSTSVLHRFLPEVVLFITEQSRVINDLEIFSADEDVARFVDQKAGELVAQWRRARDLFGCQVIQQSVLATSPRLLGNNEHRLPGAPVEVTRRLNDKLRLLADLEGVDILNLETPVGQSGVTPWHDATLWHRAKQEISPVTGPLYGDLVIRLVTARRGLSHKCLVLDLDNTLWGGVVGDDGVEGITLGQGTGEGEAFVAFQRYLRSLSQRGVVLAVCSKNDEATAFEPFDRHPEMVLTRNDIACFAANWADKPSNIRRIAQKLNLGLDALVFVDDNPFERNLVRRELPMVATPEMPSDPALFSQCISDAGYFELSHLTADDLSRANQYQQNIARETARADHADIAGYLESLRMELRWSPFDRIGVPRITQLANKTNQFNLTTRRYSESQIRGVMNDPAAIGLQFRLIDQYGDNGVIAIVIGRLQEGRRVLEIESWLMSCRVLGRQVEDATLAVLVTVAQARGVRQIWGRYIRTRRNGVVEDLYGRLGFQQEATQDGAATWRLDLAHFTPASTAIQIVSKAN